MTEWTIVTVIAALAALFVTVAKPLIGLNNSITALTSAVERLENDLSALTEKNSEAHTKLWNKSCEHDEKLGSFDTRLQMLEKHK